MKNHEKYAAEISAAPDPVEIAKWLNAEVAA